MRTLAEVKRDAAIPPNPKKDQKDDIAGPAHTHGCAHKGPGSRVGELLGLCIVVDEARDVWVSLSSGCGMWRLSQSINI